MHHPLQNEYNIITGLGNPCVKIQRQICTRTKALPLAHAQPLSVVKVADVLIDVVLGVDTVVEGEAGSFAVKMRNDDQMSKFYVITKMILLEIYSKMKVSNFLPTICF